MKNLIQKIRSEDGASNIVEAIIVYPVVFIVVVLLITLGFTYVQKGFLNHQSQKISDYLAKSVIYPGYVYIERPGYVVSEDNLSIGDINAAMGEFHPYRYLFGIFGGDAGIEYKDENVAQKYADFMANNYLSSHGYLKAYKGEITVPDGFDEKYTVLNTEGGYACAISATTSQIKVYLARNYIFAKFYSMVGVGNKKMTVSGTGITAVCDSLEIVKTVDFGVDMATFLSKKLGFDTSKLKTLRGIIQGND